MLHGITVAQQAIGRVVVFEEQRGGVSVLRVAVRVVQPRLSQIGGANLLAAGRVPNDPMCRAVVSLFPPFVSDKNVHLTRLDEPENLLKKGEYKDYAVDPEMSGLAAEVRATSMAEWRYKGKAMGRNKRVGASEASEAEGDVEMGGVGHAATRGREKERRSMSQTPGGEDDAALMGLEIGQQIWALLA